MKHQYKGNNNIRPTAPLHNLKLQIDRLEWLLGEESTNKHGELSKFDQIIIKNAINELKSVLRDLSNLSNLSKAFTIWTHPETPPKIKPYSTYYKQKPFFPIKWPGYTGYHNYFPNQPHTN